VKKSILVRTGYGAETERAAAGKFASAMIVDDLSGAADFIIQNS
jgi:hypothetical protein